MRVLYGKDSVSYSGVDVVAPALDGNIGSQCRAAPHGMDVGD